MAYNQYPMNYPQMYYPQYQAPQVQQPVQSVAQPVVQNNGLVWVQGETGAKSYVVPANGTALLMDSESDQFFIKSVDASGMPMPLRTFKYSEITHENAPKIDSETKVEEIYVTKSELANFKREVLQMVKGGDDDEQPV